MNPVGFYDSPSGEKLVQRKGIRDQYSYRRGSRFCEGYLRKCKYVTHLTLLDVGAESGGM